MNDPGANSFVLFPVGGKRFALPSRLVAELARPDRLQTFPHTTPMLSGVLVRRGHIIPVCDVAEVLVGPDAPPRKFFLIAVREYEKASEWMAVPVTGECQLAVSEAMPAAKDAPEFVIGQLQVGEERIEIVDIQKLTSGHWASAVKPKARAEASA